MTINLQIPQKFNIKPTITVFGVGGAGGNAVNNMIASNIDGVKFIVANTDAQSLDNSLTEHRMQLGETITQGLGAGSYPEVGKASAEETAEAIVDSLSESNMVFITAGMGGGTGTGAAPVIARLAREQGILTVAVVTKPFHFEGSHRMRVAELGLQELQKYVDTLVVVPNQNLFRIADKNTTFADAFKMADEVLSSGIKGITDLMVLPGLINLDFADIRSVMNEMGKAMMGTGEASGENRANEAAESAISNPLLDNVSMKGARGVLINITGGSDLTLFEVDEAANRIREEVESDSNIIFGSTFDDALEGQIRVSIVATGIESEAESNITPIFSATENEAPSAVDEQEDLSDENDDGGESFNENIDESGIPTHEEGGAFIAPEPEKVELDELEKQDPSVEGKDEGLSVSDKPFFGKSKGLGLFGRMSSGKNKSEKVDEEVVSNALPEEKAEVQPDIKTEAPEGDISSSEDFLDIPAFLRRKSS